MKFTLLPKNLKPSKKAFKFLSWLVMAFGIGVLILGMIVRDQAPAHAQNNADLDSPAEIQQVVQVAAVQNTLDNPAPNADAAQVAAVQNAPVNPAPNADAAQVAAVQNTLDNSAPNADAVQVAAVQNAPDNPAPNADAAQAASSMQSLMERKKAEDDTSIWSRIMSVVGIFAFIGIAWCMSNNKKKVLWKLVAIGTTMQLVFAVFILWTPVGKAIFGWLNDAFTVLINFTQAGVNFLFASFVTGNVEPALANTAMSILPPIIFFSSLMTILYYLGVMQWIVRGMAKFMMKFMGTSGAESLSSVANIFVGMTEAPLVVKPYVSKMTQSELFAVMSGGMATVAGGVMASYVAMLQPFFPDIAGHLIAASVMSAPASLVVAKIMYPETETPETMGTCTLEKNTSDANVIDAAARGASEGMQLAINVGAMLLAFIALIALINFILGLPSRIVNANTYEYVAEYVVSAGGQTDPKCDNIYSTSDTIDCTHGALITLAELKGMNLSDDLKAYSGDQSEKIAQTEALYNAMLEKGWASKLEKKPVIPLLSLEMIFGFLFFPFAFLMGVPLSDCYLVGQLLGEKMAVNEFVAYLHLSRVIDQLSYRSIVISTYAICGFANFGSIAIQIGGIGGMAPNRRQDIAKLGIKAMIAGTIAAFMTATIAGALI